MDHSTINTGISLLTALGTITLAAVGVVGSRYWKGKRRYASAIKMIKDAHWRHNINLPVILIGQPGSGKTSLMRCWGAPWKTDDLVSSGVPKSVNIPLGIRGDSYEEPVPFDSHHSYPVQVWLGLQVTDFPGDEGFFEAVVARLQSERKRFKWEVAGIRSGTPAGPKAPKGAALVVIYNLANIFSPDRCHELENYYSGAFFGDLRFGLKLDEGSSVHRLVLAFNHRDRLPPEWKDKEDGEIIEEAKSRAPSIRQLENAVTTAHRIEIVTMLDQTRGQVAGDTEIKGFILKNFVKNLGNEEDINGLGVPCEPIS